MRVLSGVHWNVGMHPTVCRIVLLAGVTLKECMEIGHGQSKAIPKSLQSISRWKHFIEDH
jgi:hypothetical protein